MSNNKIHPWEMGEESNSTSIPMFVEGRFLLCRIVPPKTKTVRDGLVATFAMISYKDKDGKDVVLVDISKTTNGYSIEFPLGKRGIMATKYRGPKSFYRFLNSETEKWYQIGKNDPITKVNDHCTLAFANDYLTKTNPEFVNLSEAERNIAIDEYFNDVYMFGFAKDLNLPVESNEELTPQVGMVTQLYRRYTPPASGEKYGNIIITKFATKEGKENLSSEFKVVDEEIPAAVYNALTAKDEESFDPTKFIEEDDNEII